MYRRIVPALALGVLLGLTGCKIANRRPDATSSTGSSSSSSASSTSPSPGGASSPGAPSPAAPPANVSASPKPDVIPNPVSSGIVFDGNFYDVSEGIAGDPVYSKTIYVFAGASAAFMSDLQSELGGWLKKASEADFAIKTLSESDALPSDGIVLLKSSSALVKKISGTGLAALLDSLSKTQTNEAAVLFGSPGKPLFLIAKGEKGLTNAFFTYLDKLGFKWLLPAANWTVIPKRRNFRMTALALEVPSMTAYGYFSTGGDLSLSINLLSQDKLAWLWAKRNRFPSESLGGGHTGELFYSTFKDQLAKDELNLALFNGTRNNPNSIDFTFNGRKCVDAQNNPRPCQPGETPTFYDQNDYTSYGGVIKMYADWRVSLLKGAKADQLSTHHTSAEPADSFVKCQCDKCRNLLRKGPYNLHLDQDSSISDRVYHLGNIVAQKVSETYPGTDYGATLYAYADHLLPPTIPLEKNVAVVMIPYGFNATGIPSDDIVRAWGEKQKNNPKGPFQLGIYDYLALPDWSLDFPGFPLQTIHDRLAFLQKSGVLSIGFESTYGSLSVGLHHYTMAYSLWNPLVTLDQQVSSFLSLAFGPAAPPMKRIFERWYANPLFYYSDLELLTSINDIKEAMGLAMAVADDGQREQIRSRVADYEAYIHYLKLQTDYRRMTGPGFSKHPVETMAAADKLLSYVWHLYPTSTIASRREHELVWNMLWVGTKGLPSDVIAKYHDAMASFLNKWSLYIWGSSKNGPSLANFDGTPLTGAQFQAGKDAWNALTADVVNQPYFSNREAYYEQLDAALSADLAGLDPALASLRPVIYSNNLVPLVATANGKPGVFVGGSMIFGNYAFLTVLARAAGPLEVDQLLASNYKADSSLVMTAQLLDSSGKVVATETVKGGGDSSLTLTNMPGTATTFTKRSFVLQAPAAGLYSVQLSARSSTGTVFFVVRTLSDVPTVTSGGGGVFASWSSGYVFIPKGIKTAAFYSASPGGIMRVRDPAGNLVPLKSYSNRNITAFDVADQYAGMAWKMDFVDGKITGINVPGGMSAVVDQLLVPAEVLPPQ